MTIRVTTDVFCDGNNCSQWCEGVTGIKADAKGATENAAKKDSYGKRWGRIGKKDLCPDCLALAAEGENNEKSKKDKKNARG